MEDTCEFKNCKRHDLLGGEPSQCPQYIESWWTPEGDGKPILVKDCSTKRLFLMVQELHNRLIGVQKSNEQNRNAMIQFAQAISKAKDVVSIEVNNNLIE